MHPVRSHLTRRSVEASVISGATASSAVWFRASSVSKCPEHLLKHQTSPKSLPKSSKPALQSHSVQRTLAFCPDWESVRVRIPSKEHSCTEMPCGLGWSTNPSPYYEKRNSCPHFYTRFEDTSSSFACPLLRLRRRRTETEGPKVCERGRLKPQTSRPSSRSLIAPTCGPPRRATPDPVERVSQWWSPARLSVQLGGSVDPLCKACSY